MDEHIVRTVMTVGVNKTVRARNARIHRRSKRRGASAVEFAIAAPVFVLFLYGLAEFSHARMVSNLLQTSTRQAARMGATEGVSSADCTTRVNAIVSSGVNAEALTVIVKDATVFDTSATPPSTAAEIAALDDVELNDAPPRSLFLVRATINYSDVALIGMPWFDSVVLTGQTVIRHE
ncbi:MAG: pilus assembly protein [Pirellulaceae bacterium]|jgi:Flp pilus assembly protein TadG|nr:pilus assembly protein [Pirellulaceae bacterium]